MLASLKLRRMVSNEITSGKHRAGVNWLTLPSHSHVYFYTLMVENELVSIGSDAT